MMVRPLQSGQNTYRAGGSARYAAPPRGPRHIPRPSSEPTLASPVPTSIPLSALRRTDGEVERDLSLDALRAAFAQPDSGTLWVDLDVSDDAQAALLTELFHFHPLAVEDARNPSSRVKAEEYPDFLVVVARVVSFCETTPDPYDLETANLTLFLTQHAVVTTHMESLPAVQALVERLRANPDLLQRGPARIAHQVLDTAVDAYFPVLDQLDGFVDDMEQRVFGQFDERLLQEIFKVKRLVISLRRYLAPQREVLSQLTMRPSRFLPPDAQLYFRDVYDHMLRITDALDSYRDLLSSTLDSYLSQVSNRLGSVSKGLAVFGAASIPFVVIAGVYGMNFERIPLAHHPYGFEIMVGVQVALSLGLIMAMRIRKIL
jgi:magnesium transporter